MGKADPYDQTSSEEWARQILTTKQMIEHQKHHHAGQSEACEVKGVPALLRIKKCLGLDCQSGSVSDSLPLVSPGGAERCSKDRSGRLGTIEAWLPGLEGWDADCMLPATIQ